MKTWSTEGRDETYIIGGRRLFKTQRAACIANRTAMALDLRNCAASRFSESKARLLPLHISMHESWECPRPCRPGCGGHPATANVATCGNFIPCFEPFLAGHPVNLDHSKRVVESDTACTAAEIEGRDAAFNCHALHGGSTEFVLCSKLAAKSCQDEIACQKKE